MLSWDYIIANVVTSRECAKIRITSQIADSTQLFGYFPHHRLWQPAEQPKQPTAIHRAGLIDHDLAGAGVTSHAPRQLDT
jgi:hypothetical protein